MHVIQRYTVDFFRRALTTKRFELTVKANVTFDVTLCHALSRKREDAE